MKDVQIIDNYSITNKSYLRCKSRYPTLYREILKHDKVTSSSWYKLSDKAYSEYINYWREQNDFYCASHRECAFIQNCPDCLGCPDRLHKWPTLKQFNKEFGEEYSLDSPVWTRLNAPPLNGLYPAWKLHRLGNIQKQRMLKLTFVVCACSRFGAPDDKWVPDEEEN
jgi:hypothetical protein